MKKTLLYTLSAFTLLAGSAHAVLIYSEDFTSLTLQAASTSTTNPTLTATTSGGTWSAGAGAFISAGELVFQRPDGSGGWSGSTVVLAGSLFTEGAGLYQLSIDYSDQTNNTAALFAGVYGVNYNTGSVTSLNQVAGAWNRAFPDPVSITGDATETLLGQYISRTLADGETIDFTYDGSSDVLLVFGGGRNSNNFGQAKLDNVAINSIPEPSSTALIGLCFTGLLIRRKRNS